MHNEHVIIQEMKYLNVEFQFSMLDLKFLNIWWQISKYLSICMTNREQRNKHVGFIF